MVISWLGAGPPALVEAMRELLCLEDLPSMTSPQWVEQHKVIWYTEQTFGPTFYGAEYWNRAWILQEFALVHNTEIWCEQEIMQTESFKRCAASRASAGVTAVIASSSYTSCVTGYKNRIPEDIAQCLTWYTNLHHGNCSDIRDHIFSILALVDPESLEDYPIVVDYSVFPSSSRFFQLSRGDVQRFVSERDEDRGRKQFVNLILNMLHLAEDPDVSQKGREMEDLYSASFLRGQPMPVNLLAGMS